jgi:adenine-specific DNA glycosylase
MQVGLGTHVEVELMDESGASEHLAFDIVPDAQADFAHGFLGVGTPLAQAILGQATGSTVPYRVGDVVKVQILSVTLDVSTPSADVEARRRAVIQQALVQSERISDMAFALAVGSKWGDYDPGEPKE